MLRRLSTCLLAVAVLAAYATAGEGRAVAAAGDWTWDAAADSLALSPAARTSMRPGRPSDGSPAARPLFLALPPQPPGSSPPLARRAPGAVASIDGHRSVVPGSGRSARGPPRPLSV